jgi:hypothetical protein
VESFGFPTIWLVLRFAQDDGSGREDRGMSWGLFDLATIWLILRRFFDFAALAQDDGIF